MIESAKSRERQGMSKAVHKILAEVLELSEKIRYAQGILEANLFHASVDCNMESFQYLKTALVLSKQLGGCRHHRRHHPIMRSSSL